MADTGRTVFADGFFADGFWATGFWATTVAVAIPDVVGETQGDGTTILANAGFTVTVTTAYSDSVAAGVIISQVPAGGVMALPGSVVLIVVSLGALNRAKNKRNPIHHTRRISIVGRGDRRVIIDRNRRSKT